MNKNHRKKKLTKQGVKGFRGCAIRTILLIVILSGGHDYQITTIIQLHASHAEAHKPHYT